MTTTYDTDFYAWTRQQAARLRQMAADRVNTELDLEHLAEEIEDLGDNTLAVVEGLVVQIMIHLLKLEFSPSLHPRLGWRTEIEAWRATVRRRLRRSPSAAHSIDPVSLYRDDVLKGATLALAQDGLRRDHLPQTCPWTLEQIIGEYQPANRHGLVDPI